MIGTQAYHDKALYKFTLLYFTFTSTDWESENRI